MVLWHNCKSLGKIQRRGQKESRKLKRRNHYRPLVRVIYIIDRRCSPPLITAGIQMISPKIESRRGQSSRQTKERDKQKMYTVKKNSQQKNSFEKDRMTWNGTKKTQITKKRRRKAPKDRKIYCTSPFAVLLSVSIYIARPKAVRTYTSHHTHLFSFSSMYSWSDTSGNWTTLTRTGLELCRSLLTSWTLRSWLQISPVT